MLQILTLRLQWAQDWEQPSWEIAMELMLVLVKLEYLLAPVKGLQRVAHLGARLDSKKIVRAFHLGPQWEFVTDARIACLGPRRDLTKDAQLDCLSESTLANPWGRVLEIQLDKELANPWGRELDIQLDKELAILLDMVLAVE